MTLVLCCFFWFGASAAAGRWGWSVTVAGQKKADQRPHATRLKRTHLVAVEQELHRRVGALFFGGWVEGAGCVRQMGVGIAAAQRVRAVSCPPPKEGDHHIVALSRRCCSTYKPRLRPRCGRPSSAESSSSPILERRERGDASARPPTTLTMSSDAGASASVTTGGGEPARTRGMALLVL